MEQLPISKLKQLMKEDALSQSEIDQLRTDKRKGVQQLISQYDKRQLESEHLKQLFQKMSYYEQHYYEKGMNYIAGIDEAGRGALAGPVVAAAVILPKDFKLFGLNDSKQLNAKTRDEFYEHIIKQCIAYSTAIISNDYIDEMNIFEATKKAMTEAVTNLNILPDHILIDAVQLPNINMSKHVLIKGDQKSISIAAASVIAKVTRDRLMKKLHESYPVYQFQKNMGYGTNEHYMQLQKYGISPLHRKTFSPVKEVIDRTRKLVEK